jgi:RNA polymerase sigma-70 factor, ECF subfamily
MAGDNWPGRAVSEPLGELLRQLEQPIKRYLMKQGAPAGLVDDLYQDLCVLVIEKHETLAGGADGVRRWAYRVAGYVWRNERRKHAYTRTDPLGSVLAGMLPIADDHADTRVPVQDVALATLRGLTDAERQLFLLKAYFGLDNGSLALHLGCTTRAIEMRLHRLRQKISNAV